MNAKSVHGLRLLCVDGPLPRDSPSRTSVKRAIPERQFQASCGGQNVEWAA